MQDYMIAHGSRRIGVVKNAAWFVGIQALVFLVLGIFGFSFSGLSFAVLGLSFLTGFFGAFAVLAFSKGLRSGNISMVVTITAAWGAVTAVLGILFFKEAITYVQVFEIGIIVAGTLLTSLEAKNVIRRGIGANRAWLDYSLLALFGYGMYFFLLSVVSKRIGWFDTALLSTVFSWPCIIAYAFLTKESMKVSKSYLSFFIVVAILGAAGLVLYNAGVEYSYTSIVAPVSAAAPVITIGLAVLILGERLGSTQKVGIAMVIAGIILLAL